MGVLNLAPLPSPPKQDTFSEGLGKTLYPALEALLKDKIERKRDKLAQEGYRKYMQSQADAKVPAPMPQVAPIEQPTPQPSAEQLAPNYLDTMLKEKPLTRQSVPPTSGIESILRENRPPVTQTVPQTPAVQPPVLPEAKVPEIAPQEATRPSAPPVAIPEGLNVSGYNALSLQAERPSNARLVPTEDGYAWISQPTASNPTPTVTQTGAQKAHNLGTKILIGPDGKTAMYNWDPRTGQLLNQLGQTRDTLDLVKTRADSLANLRMSPGYDTITGKLLFVSPTMNNNEPGRYAPASQQVAALNRSAFIEDIRGTIAAVHSSLDLLPEFNAVQAAQIAEMLRRDDAKSVVGPWVKYNVGRTLNTAQANYIIDLLQLKENAMAMRSVLGAGQGSDELRAMIQMTIPAAFSPDKGYAHEQLDKFELTLNRLGRAIPNVTLPEAAPLSDRGDPSVITGRGRKGQAPMPTSGLAPGRKKMVFNPATGRFE